MNGEDTMPQDNLAQIGAPEKSKFVSFWGLAMLSLVQAYICLVASREFLGYALQSFGSPSVSYPNRAAYYEIMFWALFVVSIATGSVLINYILKPAKKMFIILYDILFFAVIALPFICFMSGLVQFHPMEYVLLIWTFIFWCISLLPFEVSLALPLVLLAVLRALLMLNKAEIPPRVGKVLLAANAFVFGVMYFGVLMVAEVFRLI